MIIAIDVSVANDPNAIRWLNRLISRIEDGWHLWDVSEQDSFEDTLWITNSGTIGQGIVELYRKTVVHNCYANDPAPHGRRVRVVLDPVGDTDLAPEPASRLADERLIVLVENRDSDGAFLQRIMQELYPTLYKWWNKSSSPARFDSLGGKGQMRAYVQKMGTKSPRPRLVVVVDSDRHGPEEAPSTEAQRLQSTCDAQGFPCWVLAKREAENYLPRELLDLQPNAGQVHSKRVQAWDRLSDDQKDYFDVKNGFSKSPGSAEQNLFTDLGDADRQQLSSGFGRQIAQCWSAYKGQRKQIARTLQDRGRGDLERGLALIRKEV